MTQDIPSEEHRLGRRQRVLKKGKLLLRNNLSTVDCVIRDMSETGARIICGDPLSVPSEFRFMAVGDSVTRGAKVKWRRGNDFGIEFTTEASRAPPRKL